MDTIPHQFSHTPQLSRQPVVAGSNTRHTLGSAGHHSRQTERDPLLSGRGRQAQMPSPDKLLVPAQTGNRFGTSRPLMATLTSFMKGAMEAVEDCPHSVSPGGAAGATAIILSSGGMVGLFNAGITIGSVVAFGLQHCSGENS